jgi:hypothetical protein
MVAGLSERRASLPTAVSSWSPRSTAQNLPWATPNMGVATMLQPASEFVDLIKTNRAPATWPDVLRQNRFSGIRVSS